MPAGDVTGGDFFSVGKLKAMPQPQPQHPGRPKLATDKEQEDELRRRRGP